MTYRKINNIESVENLAGIFEFTVSLLDAMIFDWQAILFDYEDHIYLQNAFKELRDMNYEQTFMRLKNPGELSYVLIDEGLWEGQAQFSLKLYTLNKFWKQLWDNPIVKVLKAILKFLNKLLKSLKDALGAAGFIGVGAWIEIKDVTEALIDKAKDLNDIPLEN